MTPKDMFMMGWRHGCFPRDAISVKAEIANTAEYKRGYLRGEMDRNMAGWDADRPKADPDDDGIVRVKSLLEVVRNAYEEGFADAGLYNFPNLWFASNARSEVQRLREESLKNAREFPELDELL